MPANAVGRAREAAVEGVQPRGTVRALISVMRPHQWLKNLFVLAPMIFSRQLGDAHAVQMALFACVTFCLMSSGIYILNDIVDAPADRAHPVKRRRPIASGELSVPFAAAVSAALFIGSFFMGFSIGWPFVALGAVYFVSTVAYCFGLKRHMILDCILIASGFVLRVVGGAIAVNTFASHWLIVCAFLLALYLAFSKRRQELLTLTDTAVQHRRVLGEYTLPYLEQVNTILLAAVLVCYALYTVAPDTVARVGSDSLIYGTVFVLYGLLRYMALIQNSANGGDPGKLLLKDRGLMLAVAGWAVFNVCVLYAAEIFRR